MRLCLFLVLLLALTRRVQTGNSTWKIVGGRECPISEIPFMVSLRTTVGFSHFCGGTLISPKWVLSAAHCFSLLYTKPYLVTAVMGLSRIDITKKHVITAKRIYRHHQFDGKNIKNDIALVLLRQEMPIDDDNVGMIHLPSRKLHEDLRKVVVGKMTIAGWGATQQWLQNPPNNLAPSNVLRCVNVSYITFKECQKYFLGASPSQICTFSEKGGEDACIGDSGGPLFHQGVQYGIVSWGRGCAAPKTPSFHTRVDKYLDFIDRTLKSGGGSRGHGLTIILTILVILLNLNKIEEIWILIWNTSG